MEMHEINREIVNKLCTELCGTHLKSTWKKMTSPKLRLKYNYGGWGGGNREEKVEALGGRHGPCSKGSEMGRDCYQDTGDEEGHSLLTLGGSEETCTHR